MNDDARSPGSGSTPGPLSQQPPSGLDTSDPGELIYIVLKKSAIVGKRHPWQINQLKSNTWNFLVFEYLRNDVLLTHSS